MSPSAARWRAAGVEMARRRRQLGLSQERAAQRAGISLKTWRNAEQGGATRPANRAAISQALEWTIESLTELGERGRPPVLLESARVQDSEILGLLRVLDEQQRRTVKELLVMIVGAPSR